VGPVTSRTALRGPRRPAQRFGDLLRRHRLGARLTQTQLAKRAGLSRRSISQWESGQVHHPRAGSLALLADALGLTDAPRADFLIAARHRSRPRPGVWLPPGPHREPGTPPAGGTQPSGGSSIGAPSPSSDSPDGPSSMLLVRSPGRTQLETSPAGPARPVIPQPATPPGPTPGGEAGVGAVLAEQSDEEVLDQVRYAVRRAQRRGQPDAESTALHQLGLLYQCRGHLAEAEGTLDPELFGAPEAEAFAPGPGAVPDAVLERALEQQLELLDFAHELGSRQLEVSACLGLAATWEALGEAERALHHYERAVQAADGLTETFDLRRARSALTAVAGARTRA